MKETIVISMGGSIIVPDKINISFLKDLKKLLKNFLRKYKFVIVIGGGSTARKYQNALRETGNKKDEDLDWIGIEATWLNADLVRSVLSDITYPRIIDNPTNKVKFDKVLIAGGWKPGFSTDYDAVMLAKNTGAKTVINMTNVDTLYDKDPRKYKSAKKIDSIDWKGFKKLVGDKWKPGMNVPFDPVATKKAASLRLKLVMMGSNLNNFKNFLSGKKFKGSVVEN